MWRSAMRARTASRGTLAALAALALAACQEPDVGQPCDLDVYAGSPPANIDYNVEQGVACSADAADYFRSGAFECDNLICIRSATAADCTVAGAPAGFDIDVRKYCSKPCVSDEDCFTSETGLACRPIVLDSAYLASYSAFLRDCIAALDAGQPLPAGCPPNPRGTLALLGSVPSSNYCATPPRPSSP